MKKFNEKDFTEIRDLALKAIDCNNDQDREEFFYELAKATGHDIHNKDQAIGFVSAINLLLFTSEAIEASDKRHRELFGGRCPICNSKEGK